MCEEDVVVTHPEELINVADILGGEVHTDNDGSFYIRIDTGDETSKENYDDLIISCSEIEDELAEYEISDKWADHDTQIVEFKKV